LINATEAIVSGPKALQDWREEQTITVPGAQFTPQFKKQIWNGKHAPGKWCVRRSKNTWEMHCSRGVLGRLAADFTVDISNNGIDKLKPHIRAWIKQRSGAIAKLRDYQLTALNAALLSRWGRIALATNAGKGAVIALMADFAQQLNIPVLILCDELAVFDALQGEFDTWTPNIKLQYISRGMKEPPIDPGVTLAMVPTLAKRCKVSKTKKRIWTKEQTIPWRMWLGTCGMLLLDEADKATAPTWRRILANAKASRWRVGFSGTFPNREEFPYEDLRLDELMGPILIHAKNIEMVERKVSAAPLVELHGYDTTRAAETKPRKWWEMKAASRRLFLFEKAISGNYARHAFVRSLVQPNTPTAIVVNRVAHGAQLAEVIPGSVFLDGSIEQDERRKALEAFQAGKVKILIVTKILDRGTNRLGSASDLIFASGEGSTRQTLQRIGRGLRRAGGKEFLRLVDIVDRVETTNTSNKWLKMAARFVHTASRKRIELYRDEGFEVEIVT
jgi:superfamily II DNA or RNA helicase